MNDPGWGRKNDQNEGSNGQRPGDQRPDNRQDQRPDNNGDGPPDLDELWRDMNRRFNSWFGRSGGGGGGQTPRGGGDGPTMRGISIGLGILALVGALLWLASGAYIIREGQSSIELRFGQFVRQKDQAGLTMRWPYPFETHEIVNTQQLRTVEIGYRNSPRNKNPRESLMLTSDQSIIDIQFAMQYRVNEPKDFLFNNRMGAVPEEIVRQAGEAAMREIVGRSLIDRVLFEEKELVGKEAGKLAQQILDRYVAGVALVDVTVQQVQPPEEVQDAFEDANKAGQDRQRLINEGEAYARSVIPRARGNASRLEQEANGYRESVIASAEGDSDRFSKLLTEYKRAPQVTRDRLYLETMEQVLNKTSKLYMGSNSANNMLYMPLDKLLQQGAASAAPVPGSAGSQPPRQTPRVNTKDREGLRNSRDRDAFR